MFGFDFDEAVTIRRPKKGTLGVGGRPEFEQLVEAGDEASVRILCRVEERGRVTIDAQRREIRTDATLIYSPDGGSVIDKGDIVVRSGHRAYEVVGVETQKDQWGSALESRLDLVRTTIPVQEDRRG